MADNRIRDYVASLKPRSPEEVMGDAATSSLSGSMVKSTVGWLGGLVSLTIIVFLMGGGPQPEPVASDTSAQAASTDIPIAPATDSQSEAQTTPADTASNTDKAIEAMGIGETADPDAEPESMENRLDKILDGLE